MEYTFDTTWNVKEIDVTYTIVSTDDTDRQGYYFQVNA